MKRKLPLFLTAAVAVTALALSALPDPSIDQSPFQTHFYHTIKAAGLQDLTPKKLDGPDGPFNPEEVSVPWRIRWNPRRWYLHTSATAPVGFPDGGGEFQWAHKFGDGSSSPFVCTVVYLDGRASFIDIQAQANSATPAESLRSALHREFPGLPIKVEVHREKT
ncbi:hypothetical protein CfE428DRAFT_6650 [Chthoniobacter flavus Ellin428]|uniref:Uncharacterized protein n=1 Tax=Chthoniobacter flavus Ellin428 TaxID=497964 RepID=B4DCK9_9BACT|nr:hypothetical protein [Chthoniobacter flavus]EDY15823.1 hypothetical protein CfE428DRAFT_6650 [Chthoniobacter flavus Ellin428]TCO81864.1 hypothetical protein EV701_1525 [Chthoniobacter flavus]